MKYQQPEIESLHAEYDPVGVFCRGHFSDIEFLTAVRKYDEWEQEENLEMILALILEGKNPIQRKYVRLIPYDPKENGDSTLFGEKGIYFHNSKPGRGAFPITAVDFENAISWDWEH